MKLILSAFSALMCFPLLAGEPEDTLRSGLISRRSEIDQLADHFQRIVQVHPKINHIDRKSHSPLNLALPEETVIKFRVLLISAGAKSVMRGDFSDQHFKDTVYILISEEDRGDYGIQRGFVRSDSNLKPIVEMFSDDDSWDTIEFISVDDTWSLYQRRFGFELISSSEFALDSK